MLLFNVFMHTPHSCSYYNITCNNTEFLKIAVKIFDSILIKGISEKTSTCVCFCWCKSWTVKSTYLVNKRMGILWPYVIITLADQSTRIITFSVNVACFICWRHLTKRVDIIFFHATEHSPNNLVVFVCYIGLRKTYSIWTIQNWYIEHTYWYQQ